MSINRGGGLDIAIGNMSRAAGKGNTNASTHNIFKGKNWKGGIPFIEQPRDRLGCCFLARTDLKLSRENLKGHRTLSGLISTYDMAAGNALAAILDPRSSRSSKKSPLVDPYYGFNPLMDNTLVSCTGWPSNTLNVTPTTPNERGASTLLGEGKFKNGKPFVLSVEHLNIDGNIINSMYGLLLRWPTMVRSGEVGMYLDNVSLDRVDYKSRWYRFIFDSRGFNVEAFTMTGETFPISDNSGVSMNYDTSSSANTGYETVPAEWQCGGYFHNDPIVIDEFNKTQILHNPNMADSVREKVYYRVGADEGLPSLALADLYAYYGYPRIHPITLEFEIWVPNLVKDILGSFNNVKLVMEAMIRKNDIDLYNGDSKVNTEEFKELIGWTYSDLPPLTQTA